MFRYTPQTIPNNIFVIGAGGTGSRLMPMLAQFIRSITRGQSANGWLENPTIWVVDDDIVEQKNLLRQNFIQTDVGKHKAVVVAERYNRAFEVNIVPIVQRISYQNKVPFNEAIGDMLSIMAQAGRVNININQLFDNSLVIICVDSVRARRDILNTFLCVQKPSTPTGLGPFIIDAGNEDNFGQVSIATSTILTCADIYDSLLEDEKVPKLVGSIVDLNFIPINARYYRDLTDTESTASCADLDQTLAINAMMATTIMGIVQNYYYRKSFIFNCIRLSLDGSNSTDYNTFGNFKRMTWNSSKELDSSKYGEHFSIEKDKSRNYLTFTANCSHLSISKLAILLKKQIAADERAAREEREKEEKAERERLNQLKVEENKTTKKVKTSKGLQVIIDDPTKSVAEVDTTIVSVAEISTPTTSVNTMTTPSSTTTTAPPERWL
jgi:hypothetical protein